MPELEPALELSELVVESEEALLPVFLWTEDCRSLETEDLLDAFALFVLFAVFAVTGGFVVLFCNEDTSSCSSSSSSLSASLEGT